MCGGNTRLDGSDPLHVSVRSSVCVGVCVYVCVYGCRRCCVCVCVCSTRSTKQKIGWLSDRFLELRHKLHDHAEDYERLQLAR